MMLLDQPSKAVVPRALDYCFFAGYSEGVSVASAQKEEGQGGGKKGGEVVSVEVHGPAVPAGDQMDRCAQSLRRLLRTEQNKAFCDEVYGGE
jgi:hypothetical protein